MSSRIKLVLVVAIYLAAFQSVCFGEVNYPFRIVYSENSFKNGNIPVTKNEPLRLTDYIKLDSGFIILSHYSGQLFEFSGDSTIDLALLNKSIKSTSEIDGSFKYLILYESEDPKPLWKVTGAVNICYQSEIEWLFPFETSSLISENDGLCLTWKSNEEAKETNQYTVRLKNIFDEIIYEKSVGATTYLKIDQKEFNVPIEKMVIAQVTDDISGGTTQVIGLTFTEDFKLLNPCNCSKSIEWLQLAMSFETHGNYDLAANYFGNAAENSKHPIYSEFENNFRARSKEFLTDYIDD